MAVYNACKKCDAAKIIAYFGEQDIEAGYVIPSLKIDADTTVSGAVDTNVALTVQVAADLSLYDSFWLEINGVKVAEYTEANGVYTFVYNAGINNMADAFVVVLKADVAGVICSGEAVTYNFELLEGSYSAESVATDKIANATASFAGRGVLIGETVRLLYHVKASETDVLVLKKYGTDEVFATVKVSDMKCENGVYVAEIVVDAEDWDQVFSASICDAEGNVISNTNHYSVAQYASKYIVDNAQDKLSNILRAMMQYIAD